MRARVSQASSTSARSVLSTSTQDSHLVHFSRRSPSPDFLRAYASVRARARALVLACVRSRLVHECVVVLHVRLHARPCTPVRTYFIPGPSDIDARRPVHVSDARGRIHSRGARLHDCIRDTGRFVRIRLGRRTARALLAPPASTAGAAVEAGAGGIALELETAPPAVDQRCSTVDLPRRSSVGRTSVGPSSHREVVFRRPASTRAL